MKIVHGPRQVSHREPVRRIGSGRILSRDMWDFRENDKSDSDRPDYFRRGDRDSRDTGREREIIRDRDRESHRGDRDDRYENKNERYERRSFGRDFGDRGDRGGGFDKNDRNNHQLDRDKDRGGGARDRRYGNDRRRTYSEREIEEPEWFSSGPTSQNDVIELRGFEDIPEEKPTNGAANKGQKKQSPAQKKRGKKGSEKDEKTSDGASGGPKGRSTPTQLDQSGNAGPAAPPHSPISEESESQSSSAKEKFNSTDRSSVAEGNAETANSTSSADRNAKDKAQSDFNLDEFLKSDTFPGVTGLLTVCILFCVTTLVFFLHFCLGNDKNELNFCCCCKFTERSWCNVRSRFPFQSVVQEGEPSGAVGQSSCFHSRRIAEQSSKRHYRAKHTHSVRDGVECLLCADITGQHHQ